MKNNWINIGGITPLSTIDYPGMLATTIYTQGCNFRCVYCQNYNLVEYRETPLSYEYVKSFLKLRKRMIDGVVICGGEPTIHKDLPFFCKWLKEMGFKVKLDTNGSNPRVLESLINNKLIDFVAMDIKAPWEKYHRIIGTDFPLDRLKRSVEIIKQSGIPYNFRTTVHSRLHTLEDLKKIATIVGPSHKLTLQLCRPTERFKEKNAYGRHILEEMAKELGIAASVV